jgi:transposase
MKSTSKFPSLPQNTDAMISYKEPSNKFRQSIHRVRPNRNMKDVLLLHDNARPHSNLRIREAAEKRGWTVLPNLLTAKIWHPLTTISLAL